MFKVETVEICLFFEKVALLQFLNPWVLFRMLHISKEGFTCGTFFAILIRMFRDFRISNFSQERSITTASTPSTFQHDQHVYWTCWSCSTFQQTGLLKCGTFYTWWLVFRMVNMLKCFCFFFGGAFGGSLNPWACGFKMFKMLRITKRGINRWTLFTL